MKPRLVIDTNVLVSHFILPGHNPTKVMDLILAGKAVLITSEFILQELEEVLKNKIEFNQQEAANACLSIRSLAEIVKPYHAVDVVVGDESDNRILECALSGKADIVISGDKKHLQPLKVFKGIRILSPTEFLIQYMP